MPPRSIVETLPAEVRGALDSKLVASGFSNYVDLANWLTEQGFEIKKSALQSYGAKFEDRLSKLHLATGQAKAIVEASPDDEGAMSEALMKLVQEKLFGVLIDLDVDQSKVSISGVAKAIADLGRATVTQKKFASDVRSRAREAAKTAERIASKGGLSKEGQAEIRAAILGITK